MRNDYRPSSKFTPPALHWVNYNADACAVKVQPVRGGKATATQKKLAPWAGLEPATYWLQAPRDFSRAWTISSPVPPKWESEGVGRFPRPAHMARSGVRACALVSAPSPRPNRPGGLAQDRPLRDREGRVSLSSPDSSTTISRGSCKPYSQPLCRLSYQGADRDKVPRMRMEFKTLSRAVGIPP
jgi:hypothetical protein